jgi:hypothetical protein
MARGESLRLAGAATPAANHVMVPEPAGKSWARATESLPG